MPFSITTKDGITINNIPDDIAPDAQVLKDRVADIRVRRAASIQEEQDLGRLTEATRARPVEEQRQVSEALIAQRRAAGLPENLLREPTALAAREQALAQLPEAQRALVEDIGPLEATAIGAGRGLTTIARGVGLAEPEDPASRAGIEALKSVRGGAVGTGEVLGESAPFLAGGVPAAGIKALAPRVAATTGVGALEGGIIARGQGKDVGTQLFSAGIGGSVAGALELAIPVVGRLGGKIIRRSLNKSPDGAVIDAAGNPSAEFLEALSRSGQSFDDVIREAREELAGEAVEPGQAARKAFLESQGLDPTKAQVSRNASDFMSQQEAAKTSNRVREALERQEAVLTSRFDNQILETGGQATTPTSTVTDALTEKASVLDQKISDLYAAARQAAPGEKNVRFEALATKLRQAAPSNRVTGGAVEAVVGDLQAKGILDKNMKVVGRVDVQAAEDVRKLMNELFDPQNGFRNAVLRKLKDGLDDDVFKAAGDDVFNAGRAAKRDFEQELSRAKISKFDKRKANLVRDVLENKVNPDKFTQDVIFGKKWRGSDLQQLKDYIGTTPAGRKAFDDLRAETLHNIKERSFIGPIDEAGNKALSRDKLQKSIESIGREKMNVLFTAPEQKFLKDMLEVAKLREPVRGTALGRGPSAQAIARLEKRLADLPGIGSLVNIINLDAQGKLALKASPERIAPKALPSPAAAAPAAAALAIQEEER